MARSSRRLRGVRLALLFSVLSALSWQVRAAADHCGMKPFPRPGCTTGACVNGEWQQKCDSGSGLACGLKPIPRPGCRIGRCVEGTWEQYCESRVDYVCGLKPQPARGCRVGRCVDGVWEQECD